MNEKTFENYMDNKYFKILLLSIMYLCLKIPIENLLKKVITFQIN